MKKTGHNTGTLAKCHVRTCVTLSTTKYPNQKQPLCTNMGIKGALEDLLVSPLSFRDVGQLSAVVVVCA